MKSLAVTIREARRQRGLSQVELAARLGVSQGTISLWETGAGTPTFKNLVRLAVELPDLTVVVEEHELNLLRRLRELERQAARAGCGCPDCACVPASVWR